MSSVSSTSTLASWDPMELFHLMNPDKMSITCVGYAPSCRRRCRNPIAYHNIQAAKAVMRQLVHPGISNTDLKEMLFDLAGYTLCRRYHQDQAMNVSDRWFDMVQRHHDDDEEDRFSDTSDDGDDGSDDYGASSTSSSSDDSDDDDEDDTPPPRANDSAQELRRRFDELETLQCEFEELLQRQRQTLHNRMRSTSLVIQTQQPQATQRPDSEPRGYNSTTRKREDKKETLRNAEQLRQEEAHRAAQRAREIAREQLRRERAERLKREEAEREARREKKAEAERLLKEQAEKARLERERQAKEKKAEQWRMVEWEMAWMRYKLAWEDIADLSVPLDDDILTSEIWPTKTGAFVSCCEEDVKAFSAVSQEMSVVG